MIFATWIQTKTNQVRCDGADVEDSLDSNCFILPLVSIQIQH